MKKMIIIFATLFSFSAAEAEEVRLFVFDDITPQEYERYLTDACSLACAIGWEFSASSSLSPQGDNSYTAKNLGDASLSTAWVEGGEGYGIGEYIVATIDQGLNETGVSFHGIQFINGYTKSDSTWQKNSRIKRIKFFHNNEFKFTLHLKDTSLLQVARFDSFTIYSGDKLKFEVEEVYKGDLFSDVAISEINLIGAH